MGFDTAISRTVPRTARLMLALLLTAGPAAAAGDLATQSPSSAQPTLPTPMPNLTVPVAPSQETRSLPSKHTRAGKPRHRYARRHAEPLERPALANVELLEPLPHPPQPPHVVVPTPAYPLENFVTAFTTPPPPIVCRPTRSDRFKPNLRLIDERPVLCAADNP